MANGGFFLVYRKIWENSMLKDEPFNRLCAWLWLVSEASYQASDRGQVVVSERQLAKAWQWDRFKVRRFLAELEKSGMIKRGTCPANAPLNAPPDDVWKTRGETVVSICNYAKYQSRVAKTEIENFGKTHHQTHHQTHHTLKKEPSLSSGSILKESASDFSNSSGSQKSNLDDKPVIKATDAERDAKIAEWQKVKSRILAKWDDTKH